MCKGSRPLVLQELRAAGAWRLDGTAALQSLASLTSLQALDLSSTATQLGMDLLAQLQRATGLTRLQLNHVPRCPCIAAAAAARLACSMEAERAPLCRHYKVSIAELLVPACLGLQHLELDHSVWAPPHEDLPVHHLRHLSWVRLCLCFVMRARMACALSRLVLQRGCQLPAWGLVRLLQGLPHLRYLDFSSSQIAHLQQLVGAHLPSRADRVLWSAADVPAAGCAGPGMSTADAPGPFALLQAAGGCPAEPC